MPSSIVDLYVWVAPAYHAASPLDHTWVTDYDIRDHRFATLDDVAAARRHCWLCWGDYRARAGIPGNPTGYLADGLGDRARATCLVRPNEASAGNPPAQGTIFRYGRDGVCHQLANQVLRATGRDGAAPVTVEGARGYGASSYIYGTYGLQEDAWADKLDRCTVSAAIFAAGASAMPADRADTFETRARALLADEPERLRRLLAARRRARRRTGIEPLTAEASSAEALNARNQALLDEAARILGPERFEEVFGFPAGQTMDLVDPAMLKPEP